MPLINWNHTFYFEPFIAGKTIAAINNATPPTVAKPFDAFELVVEAAKEPTVEITIRAKVATDLFILIFFIFTFLLIIFLNS